MRTRVFRKIIVLVAVITLAATLLTLAAPIAQAVGGGIALPFGGRIILVRPGNNCIVIDVGPPVGGEYIFQFGFSRLYSFFALHPGAWVLGISTAASVCFLGKFPIGAGPVIIMVGTSL